MTYVVLGIAAVALGAGAWLALSGRLAATQDAHRKARALERLRFVHTADTGGVPVAKKLARAPGFGRRRA